MSYAQDSLKFEGITLKIKNLKESPEEIQKAIQNALSKPKQDGAQNETTTNSESASGMAKNETGTSTSNASGEGSASGNTASAPSRKSDSTATSTPSTNSAASPTTSTDRESGTPSIPKKGSDTKTTTTQQSTANTSTETQPQGGSGATQETQPQERGNTASTESGTTAQTYAGVSGQQTVNIPQEFQENSTEPTLEAVNKAIDNKIKEGDNIDYWEGVKKKLETISPKELAKSENENEKDTLFKKLYDDLNNSSALEIKNLDWTGTGGLQEKMVKAINDNIIAGEKDQSVKRHWDNILKAIEEEDENVSRLFDLYDELFLLLREVLKLETLPTTISITVKTDVYTKLNYKNLYAKIGKKDVYPYLKKIKDVKGSGVIKIWMPKVKGKGTVFGNGQKLKFEVKKPLKISKKGINWAIYDAESNKIYEAIDKNKTFEYTFNEYGDYIVEAYGGFSSFKTENKTLDEAQESSKAGCKTQGRKSYMAITIKEPKLIGITSRKTTEFIKGQIIKLEAKFDVVANAYPELQWIHYFRQTETEDYLPNTVKEAGKSIEFEFTKKGYHYFEVCYSENKSTEQITLGNAKKPLKVGGNYITTIKETKHKKRNLLFNTDNALQFEPKSYKLGSSNDFDTEKTLWQVYKNKKRLHEHTGAVFTIENTKTYAEGEYTIKTRIKDPVLGEKASKAYSINIVHPQITQAYWADNGGAIKYQSGNNVDVANYIKANITHWANKPVDIKLYKDVAFKNVLAAIPTETDKSGSINYKLCFEDYKEIIAYIKEGKDETPLYFNIEAKNYTFKTPNEGVLKTQLKIFKGNKIIKSYFTYNNTIIDPCKHVVPYGTKIQAVVETTNMIDEKLKLELYNSKDSLDYSGKHVEQKSGVAVNNDGKAIVNFELQKDWDKDHKTHKYFYIRVKNNEDSWQGSLMLQAYEEGDMLEDGVETLGLTNKQSNFEKYQKKVFDHEGGYVDHPSDKGGKTNKGITLETFKAYAKKDLGIEPTVENLKKLTNEQAAIIYKKGYWDKVKADQINNASVAFAIYDFSITSGGAIKAVQQTLNELGQKVTIDGKFGDKTVNAINSVNAKIFFDTLQKNRKKYYQSLIDNDSSQSVFKKGWFNRVDGIKFEKESNGIKKQEYSIEKAIKKINENAKKTSTGYCAKYVRLSLEAGGLNAVGHPVSAKDYDKFLPKIGFKNINSENYVPIKGDIVVIDAFDGKKKHPHGHIQAYNGSQWISDFEQKDFWPGSDYRNNKPKYTIFRW